MASAGYAKMIASLIGGATLQELINRTGFNKDTVGSHIRALRAFKAIHISEWVGEGTGATRVHKIGNLPDAPRQLSDSRIKAIARKEKRTRDGSLRNQSQSSGD